MRRIAAIGLILALAMTSPAGAACRWSQDCSSGVCLPIPLCDHVHDVPGGTTGDAMVPRVVPPGVTPVITPIVPPPGASRCTQRNICDDGHCSWQSVCQ